jgi:hypothetical protein
VENIGRPWVTFVERTGSGDERERRVLFEGGLDVDFIMQAVPDVSDVARCGIHPLLDKDGLAACLAGATAETLSSHPPTQNEFLEVVNDFWYHAVWTAKKLSQGEVNMPVNWMDVSPLSFNTLLLLERVQLSWFPGWAPEAEMAIALRANPAVEWYLRHKCPELEPWLDSVMARASPAASAEQVRQAEVAILQALDDLLVYAVDPAVYDVQSFLKWDSNELTSLADFTGKTVIDVGSGTGRLALTVADEAQAVFAVEPVANLRHYLKHKASSLSERGLPSEHD